MVYRWSYIVRNRQNNWQNVDFFLAMNGGSPIAGWFIMEDLKLIDFGVPPPCLRKPQYIPHLYQKIGC